MVVPLLKPRDITHLQNFIKFPLMTYKPLSYLKSSQYSRKVLLDIGTVGFREGQVGHHLIIREMNCIF